MSRTLHRWSALALVWAAVVALLAPMQGSWFAVVDDHHVMRLAGADGRITPAEAVASARGWLGEQGGRFRPLFWVLWHLEAWWAGTDPARWHLDRLLLALATATALYFVAEAVLPPSLAALAAFTFFCGFQNEAWMRLVTQEVYGSVLAAAGLALLARRIAGGRASPVALLPGLLLVGLAGLAKESFAPLLPAALLFLYVLLPRLGGPAVPFTRRDRVALAVLILLSAAVCAAALNVRLVHGPYYREPITPGSFVTNAWRHLWLLTKDSGWPVPVAAAAAAMAWTRAGRVEWVRRGGWLAAGASLLLVPQWIVYGGGPFEGRYVVPGCLFAVWATALGLRTLHERDERVARGLLVVAVASLAWFEAKWVWRDREVARGRARAAQEHRAALDAVAATLARAPSLEVVFRTEDPFDLGRVDSAWWFLGARLGPGFRPYLLATDEHRSQPGRALGDYLAELQRTRAEGRETAFRAWSTYRGDAGQCLEITFHADPRRAVCRERIAFPSPEPRLTAGPGTP